MVVTVYDLSFLHYPARLSVARRLYLRALTALTCARARRVLAISQSTANDLRAHLGVPAKKIDVTPLGYDRAAFRPLLETEKAHFRRKQNLPERFWLFVGTLEPRKNLPMLLKAYAQLPKAERLPLILGGGIGWRARESSPRSSACNWAAASSMWDSSLPPICPSGTIALKPSSTHRSSKASAYRYWKRWLAAPQ